MNERKKAIYKKGQKFGKWEIIREASKRGIHRYMLCRCVCGREKEVALSNLKYGRSIQCISCAHKKHGLSHHPLYEIWEAMKQRCLNPNYHQFCDWGGRGIIVCEGWKNDFKVFHDFCIANGWNKGLEIDRIDNDGHYCPENCRFVTHRKNSLNQRKRKTNRSGFTGVYWDKILQKWRAQITIHGKNIHLGCYQTREEAFFARNKYIIENNISNAYLAERLAGENEGESNG